MPDRHRHRRSELPAWAHLFLAEQWVSPPEPPTSLRPEEEAPPLELSVTTRSRPASAEAMLDVDGDLASGLDSVLERLESGEHRVTRLRPSEASLGPIAEMVELAAAAAPVLTLAEATTWLDDSGGPFVFFADASTGRGNVLYRRYDGHYGLVTPD